MNRTKPKPTYKVGDRFRAKQGGRWTTAMPYHDREIVIIEVLHPWRLMYSMAADDKHFDAHRDWLYSYWEKIEK